MKFINYVYVLCTCSMLSCGASEVDERISLLQANPHVIKTNGNELFQYWEVPTHKYLWEYELGEVKALEVYKDSISESISAQVLQNMIREERIQSRSNSNHKDSLNNYELIHNGYLGKIREINFIEAEILNYQASRFPMFSHPTEFHGFLIANDSLGLIRIYFAAGDQPWPPKATPIISHLENALSDGWYLMSHLHNHYQPAEDNYVGAMAPSLADAHYFKILKSRFDLPEALITNGFSTLILKDDNFDKLNAHGR